MFAHTDKVLGFAPTKTVRYCRECISLIEARILAHRPTDRQYQSRNATSERDEESKKREKRNSDTQVACVQTIHIHTGAL